MVGYEQFAGAVRPEVGRGVVQRRGESRDGVSS